jgi:glycosyltransferase involved in cell wall biosynthesis
MTWSSTKPQRVSVIIPTFNRSNLLPETIQSVIDQTFTAFEIVVVDDGSTDNTEQAIQHIQDERLICIRQPHSGLPAVARNTGLRHAQAEYIAFIDSDDLWLKEKLSTQVCYMDSHPKLGLSYTNYVRFGNASAQHNLCPILEPHSAPSGHSFNQLYGHPVIANSTVMIRAAVIDTVGVFDEDKRLRGIEDYDYWLRIAYHYPIGFIAVSLTRYRLHADRLSQARVASERNKLFLIAKLDRMYPDFVAIHAVERQDWLSRVHHSMGRHLLRADRATEARQHLKKAWKLRRKPTYFLFWLTSFLGRGLRQHLKGVWRILSNKTKPTEPQEGSQWPGKE